jgi:hypothetical protein
MQAIAHYLNLHNTQLLNYTISQFLNPLIVRAKSASAIALAVSPEVHRLAVDLARRRL